MSETEIIRWRRDPDGVVVLTMDDPARSASTLNQRFVAALADTVERLRRERDDIAGVVLTSAKKTFFAGGDLNELLALQAEDAARFTIYLNGIKAVLRKLETLGRPVVAAVNGAALGGGLELALATHHRIVADVPGSQVGLPEVDLGLLPACGGVVRVVRHLGVAAGLEKVLLSAKRFSPAEALGLGLVDEVVPTIEKLVPLAKLWITANPDPLQPWDRPGFTIPGGTPARRPLAAQLPYLSADLRRRTAGAPSPAARAIVAAAVEGAQVDLDAASLIETRYLVQLVVGQIAKNRIKAKFFDLQHIASGASRPSGEPTFRSARLAVVGAGMMGAGIAYVAAQAGIDVVLKDVSTETAAKARAMRSGWRRRRSSAAGPPSRTAMRCSHASARPATWPTWPTSTSWSRRYSRTPSSRRRSLPSSSRWWALRRSWGPTPQPCRSVRWPGASDVRGTSSASISSHRSTGCRLSRSSGEIRPRPPPWPRPSTSSASSARRRSWSTTAAGSSPAGSSSPA